MVAPDARPERAETEVSEQSDEEFLFKLGWKRNMPEDGGVRPDGDWYSPGSESEPLDGDGGYQAWSLQQALEIARR